MKFFAPKSNELDELVSIHIDAVDRCLREFLNTWKMYLRAGDYKAHSFKVHQLEHEADKARRDIELILRQGAFMTKIRGDIMLFIEYIDKIANSAESTCDALCLERPEVPKELKEEALDLVKASIDTFLPFKKIRSLTQDELNFLHEVVVEVEELEQNVDKMEWRLLKNVFENEELDLAHKIHLRDIIKRSASISDRAEDASDHLDLLIVGRKI